MSIEWAAKVDLDGEANCSCFSPDGKRVFFGLAGGDVLTVVVSTFELLDTTHTDFGVIDVKCSANLLAATCVDMTVLIFKWKTLKLVKTLNFSSYIHECMFSPDGSLLVVTCDDSATIWDTNSWQCLHTLDHKTARLCDFSPSGLEFLTLAYAFDGEIKIWDAKNFNCKATIQPQEDNSTDMNITRQMEACRYSPDGKYFASVSKENNITIWNSTTYERVIILDEKEAWIFQWSLNGKYIIASGNNIKVWNIETQQCEQIEEVDAEIHHCSMSGDGTLLVTTSSYDTDGVFWDLKNMSNSEFEEQTESLLSDSYLINSSLLNVFKNKMLGQGKFGKVYEGLYDKIHVAVKKIIPADTADTEKVMEDFKNEVQTLMEVSHKNIVTCYGCSYPVIVLELMQENLYSWIHKQTVSIEEAFTVRILHEIASGMHYLHTRNPMVVHRDLKSLNILLDNDLHAKITDFGLSKTKQHSQPSQVAVRGTIPWAAPEYLWVERYNERNEKGDVFSFGVIAWELVTQQVPWRHEQYTELDIMQLVLNGERLKIPENCPKYLQSMMLDCWDDKPSKRPSFQTLLSLENKMYNLKCV